ncbi:uncharacterized protein LOC116652928 [Coturnix japonica]|uniref:uncharacterized protein LOC116652928 n=1 Tax=Coturnix japonica TaxID=93934 RepID=UPI0013A5CA47|nr:uncharacterized protein LOC116652928 [Coturnix japonica]
MSYTRLSSNIGKLLTRCLKWIKAMESATECKGISITASGGSSAAGGLRGGLAGTKRGPAGAARHRRPRTKWAAAEQGHGVGATRGHRVWEPRRPGCSGPARPGPPGLRRRCPLPSSCTGSRGTPVCALCPPPGLWMERAQLQPPRPLSALSSPFSPRLRSLPFSPEKRKVALRRYLGCSASLTSPLNMINVPSARNETILSPDCSKEESRFTSHLPNLRSPGGHTRVITGDCANAALSKSTPITR